MQRNKQYLRSAILSNLRLAAMVATVGLLSACSSDDRFQYLERSDNVLNDTGDAVASNIISQTVDPWPPHSLESETETDGKRVKAAVDRYRNDRVRASRASGTSNGGRRQNGGGVTN